MFANMNPTRIVKITNESPTEEMVDFNLSFGIPRREIYLEFRRIIEYGICPENNRRGVLKEAI
jgi:hypothetical protein